MCSLGIKPTTFCAADAMLYHWATLLYLLSIKIHFKYLTKYLDIITVQKRYIYPKWLTIGEHIMRLILKRQTDTGSARNTKFQALFQTSTS